LLSLWLLIFGFFRELFGEQHLSTTTLSPDHAQTGACPRHAQIPAARSLDDPLDLCYIHCEDMRDLYWRGVILAVIVLSAGLSVVSAEEGESVPDAVRRPSRADMARYPRDSVIGELGRGELPPEDLDYAAGVLRALMQGREQSLLFQTLNDGVAQELMSKLQTIQPRKYRIGGGKEVVDGAGSFLFRFIGRNGQIGGVMYFVRGEKGYMLDDILLEDIPQMLLEENGNTASRLFPYERFY
jgi:hypothetical protein